ncbi:DUF1003 domain-containing protein [Verrucomicrobium sp. GAS474]|uniref:DUF1003 domain-containing protein n=1 Tax=Verrucomicrobium sp. GAS474 TaxID=1882831 RepID=UPI0031B6477B
MERESSRIRTPGQRIADAIASGVGSWPFILIQSGLYAVYIVLNVVGYMRHWDPYPFVLLNLFLSFQAAYTGPILMMSQNRQSRLAERRNHLDLQINMMAERESTETLRLLRQLCQKHGIDPGDSDECSLLEQKIEPEKMLRQIEQAEQAQPPEPRRSQS